MKDEESKKPQLLDENEVFKSLSHKIRRDIIRSIGNKEKSSFTEIKNTLQDVDSPSLSYHLKSMQSLLVKDKNRYRLSQIGKSAHTLLKKIDQSQTITKYRKRFVLTYLLTVVCWSSVQTIIPIIFYALNPTTGGFEYFYIIHIILSIFATINYILIWQLKKD